jgi:Flp pilus assembly protein TadD
MKRVARFGIKGLLAAGIFAIASSSAGCGTGAEATKDPVLTADPPLGEDASGPKGASATELQRGKTYIENEKYGDAKEHLQKAMDLDPSSSQAMFYFAVAEEGLGDAAAAEASYKKALAADPKFAEAAQNLAALYLRDPARPDEAIKLLNDALAKVPGDIGLLQNLAFAYVLKKDVENASRQYEAILAKKGGDTPQVRLAYAELLLEAKLRDRAAEQLKKVLAGTEEDASKLVTVGRLLAAAGAYGDCVGAFTRAIAIKADDPGLFMRRGRCRQELKDEGGARADFESALKIDPKFVPAHYQLGLSWLAEKNIPNAKASLTKAADLGKGTEIGKSARQKLDELPKK